MKDFVKKNCQSRQKWMLFKSFMLIRRLTMKNTIRPLHFMFFSWLYIYIYHKLLKRRYEKYNKEYHWPLELVLFFQKRLDGYLFPVFLTQMCPKNETEWNERFFAINCTASNGYMCLPNENFTQLLEFCYTEPRIWILKGTKSFYEF